MITFEVFGRLIDRSAFGGRFLHFLTRMAAAKQEVENLVQKEMEASEDNRKVEEGVPKFIEWIRSGKLEEGGLPKQTAKNTLRALDALKNELINPFKVLAVLQTHIPERLLQSHYSEQNPAVFGSRIHGYRQTSSGSSDSI